ncbi:histidine kinase [Glacieibacterium sp.]|uniref:histidine kinase n=1 Tax=Glacieibacterium sp. TaxID=2860237 RepID=UPI003B00C9BE
MWRWLALGVVGIMLAGAVFSWTRGRPVRPGVTLASAPAAAQTLVDEPPLVAPVSDVTPADREARRFNRYDKDRDASITQVEYFVARRKAFAKLDLDGDGKLSFDEYSAKALKKFATADADHDGKLVAVEFATTAAKRRPAAAKLDCPPVVEHDES